MGAVISPQVLFYGSEVFNLGWKIMFHICGITYFLFGITFLIINSKKNNTSKERICTNNSIYMLRTKNHSSVSLDKGMLVLMSIALFAYGGLEIGVSYYLDTYFNNVINRPDASANILSLFWLVMIPSRIIGALFVKIKMRIMIYCYAISAILLIVISLVHEFWLVSIMFILLGFCLGPLWAFIMSSAAEDNSCHTGIVSGIVSAGCGLGAIIFPIILGYFAEVFDLSNAFFILASISILGMLVCFIYAKLKNHIYVNA